MYAGETAIEKMLAHQEEPIPPLPNVPKKLQAAYHRMVAKKVEDGSVDGRGHRRPGDEPAASGTPAWLAAWLQGAAARLCR